MDRQTISEHLALADRHIAQGEKHLARQEALIAKLDRDGHDTTHARMILTTLRDSQALHYQDRDPILRELDEIGSPPQLAVPELARA